MGELTIPGLTMTELEMLGLTRVGLTKIEFWIKPDGGFTFLKLHPP
jgi:hypothetical protein